MNTQGGNSKPLSINMILMIIVVILVVVLIFVSVLNIGKKEPIKSNNVNNGMTNDITNDVEDPSKLNNKVNTTANITTDPNANNPEVAKVGEQTFNSLQEAINAIEAIKPEITPTPSVSPTPTPAPVAKTQIILLKNISGSFIIGENKHISIDMGNYSITGIGDKEVFTVNGDLELQNGKIIGKYNKQLLYAIKVNKSGILTCDKMNFDLTEAEFGWAITNDGILNIKSTRVDYPKGTAINNNGLIGEISGESYISSNDNYIALNNLGTIEKINGGELIGNSYALFNSGTIKEISGNMKITSLGSYGIYNSGSIESVTENVEISSGSADTATIYNNGGKIDKISGNVKINAEHNRAIYNLGTITEISGNVSINTNGEYSVSTIYNSNPGELTIMGGTVSHKNGGISVFRDGGVVNITGGNISSKYNC